jgi:uncharacterized repeat protein (TIGR01451 family)
MHVGRVSPCRRCLAIVAAVVGLACAAPAAAQAAPAWSISAVANTTALPGSTFTYYVNAVNIGTDDADGVTPINLDVTLPAGITAVSVSGRAPGFGLLPPCTAGDGVSPLAGASTIRCTNTFPIPALSGSMRPAILVAVDPGATIPTTLTAHFDVSGGGAAADASTAAPVRIDNPPPFGIAAFDNQVASDPAGDALTQAGGHPYSITTAIDINSVANPAPIIGDLWPAEPLKDAIVDLPPGLVGSTAGVDQCTAAQLAHSEGIAAEPLCPATSQVGTTLLRLNGFGSFPNVFGPIPVFNMAPPPGVPAQFGFSVFGSVVTLTARLRSATDYGLSVDGDDISEGLAIAGTTVTFWGVPSDPSHDSQRACPGKIAPWSEGPSCPSGAPPAAFLRNPTSCAPPAGSPVNDGLATNVSIDSWDHPGARDANGAPAAGDPSWRTATSVTHAPPGYPEPPSSFGAHLLPTGCDKVPFDPTLSAEPSSAARAGSPTAFTVDLDLPQSSDPTTIGEADLKKAVVTLPAGMRVSPSSADGLGACSPAQIGLHSAADATCPESSKIGTLTLTTPLIDQQLTGSIYLATPHENPFGSLLAIYLVARGSGVVVKLAGHVEADPSTGQLTTTFDDNPQLPFSNLHLEFNGGARAPLVAPPACGTYTTHAVLSSWSGATVASDSSFTIDANSDGSPCAPAGFSPGLSAGTANPVAGASSPFLLRLTRSDGDQELSSLTVDMPTGLLGRIANAVLCPDGAASAGACEDVSKVGSVTVGAGAGPDPFYITTGRAYITGPYKGAPYGLSIVVPAVAGPFDLGNVVVRTAIGLDRQTAQLHVVSDPLPTILQGIPLDIRDVRVAIDKPDFIVNPTSCAAKQVLATVGSTLGAVAHLSTHFQVTNCAALPLAPRFSLTVGARGHTRAGVSTPLTATLTQTPGQANLRSVSVTLPGTLNALLPVVNRACTLSAFEAGHCGSRARVGSAVAVTPLLRDPLRGSAYFVKNPARAIPDLMVALRGQVSLDLTGKVTIPGGTRLATHFDTIPDAAITKFSLRLVSGANGPVGIVTNLCSAKSRAATAAVAIRGQNGTLIKANQHLHLNGCPRARKARRARR